MHTFEPLSNMRPSSQELYWYWQRLRRMAPSELAHRFREHWRHWHDRSRGRGWSDFTPLDAGPLPGLDATYVRQRFSSEAFGISTRVKAGELRLLGQTWPLPKDDCWWNSDHWFLDPVTNRLWPGRDSFGPDIPYRHMTDMGDVKFVWELNRLQFLPHVALSDPNAALGILTGWMDANLPFSGINWTSGIEAATRVVSVLAAISVGMAAPRENHRVGQFLRAHAYWIARYPSLYSSANNHRIGELAGLFVLGCAAPDFRREISIGNIHAALESEALLQFYPDGVGAEHSLSYAAYSLEWLAIAGIAADATGMSFGCATKSRLRAAAETLRWVTDTSGEVPHIGDRDGSHAVGEEGRHYEASVTSLAERWLSRQCLPSQLFSPSLRDAIEPQGFDADELPPGVRTFDSGGYTVWRVLTEKGLALVVFDHGALGYLSIAAHGHADALSVWLHLDREKILIDAGTYLYHSGGAARNEFRGTGMHNTLSIEGSDQSQIVGPFAWRDHAHSRLICSDGHSAEAEHDGYLRRFGLVHRRRVVVQRNSLAISDYILGRPKRRGLAWTLGFTLDPDIIVAEGNGYITMQTQTGRRLTFKSLSSTSVVEANYSREFNQLGLTRKLHLSGTVEQRDQSGLISSVTISIV
jgi:Heparinase II/III-like protein/Heparinase II/III N-terminus